MEDIKKLPLLGNQFLNRLVLSFIPFKERLSTLSTLNKYFFTIAYDCSLIKSISVAALVDQNLSYDIQDYLTQLLETLTRPEQLKQLDLTSQLKGQHLPDQLLKVISKFKGLSVLRLPPVSTANWKLIQNCKFLNCEFISLPVLCSGNEQFFYLINQAFPNLKGIQIDCANAFQVPVDFKIPSLEKIELRLGNILHQEIKQMIVPLLEHVRGLKITVPNYTSIVDIFEACPDLQSQLISFELRAPSENSVFQKQLDFSSLKNLRNLSIKEYNPLLQPIIRQNENLETLFIGSIFSKKQFHLALDSFVHLKQLEISHDKMGSLKLNNLPSLNSLIVPHLHLKSFKTYETQNNLGLLNCFINYLKLPIEFDLDINYKNLHTAAISKFLQIKDPSLFKYASTLATSDIQIINLHKDTQKVRNLELFNEGETPMEKYINSLVEINSLRNLTVGLEQQDPQFKFIDISLAQIVSFSLIIGSHTLGQIDISDKCKNLQNICFAGIQDCNYFINAPQLQDVIFFYCQKIQLFIESKSIYSAKFKSSQVNISRCPGLKALYIENDRGGAFQVETLQKEYYPHLRTVEARILHYYEYKFWENLEQIAPHLQSLSLQFGDFIKQTSKQDKMLIVKHSKLKWVDLKKGGINFQILKIHKDCKQLRLVKFRDFELLYFSNDANAPYSSEKNIVQGEHFE